MVSNELHYATRDVIRLWSLDEFARYDFIVLRDADDCEVPTSIKSDWNLMEVCTKYHWYLLCRQISTNAYVSKSHISVNICKSCDNGNGSYFFLIWDT